MACTRDINSQNSNGTQPNTTKCKDSRPNQNPKN